MKKRELDDTGDDTARQLFKLARRMEKSGLRYIGDADQVKAAGVPELLLLAGVALEALAAAQAAGQPTPAEVLQAWRWEVFNTAGGIFLGEWVRKLPDQEQRYFLQVVRDTVPMAAGITAAQVWTWWKQEPAERRAAFIREAQAYELAEARRRRSDPEESASPIVGRIGVPVQPKPPDNPTPAAAATMTPTPAAMTPAKPKIQLTTADRAALASPAIRWAELPILLTVVNMKRLFRSNSISTLHRYAYIPRPVITSGNVVRWQKETVRQFLEERRRKLLADGVPEPAGNQVTDGR